MISGQERRRVAANLRQYLKKYETPDWRAFCNIILGEGRLDNLRKAQTFDRLADLIDCETCHLVEDDDGRTACSECGCTALCMLDASYCPECGRKVVRDGD